MSSTKKKPLGIWAYSLLWSTRAVSVDIATAFFAYTTFYATDVLKLPPTTVGALLIIAKVFDGVTDILVGYLIDRTHTKWGKARPYELALIGFWGSGILLLASPIGSMGLMLFYFFFMYSLRTSGFSTFLACSEPVYYANSIPDYSQSPKVMTIRGTVCGIGTIPVALLLPFALKWADVSRDKWIIIGLAMAIPLTLLGLLRFFFVPEIHVEQAGKGAKFNFSEGVRLLLKNKYVWIYSLVLFLTYVSYNLSSNSGMYYAKYVLGDLSAASLLTLSGTSAFIVTLCIPIGFKKLGMNGFVKLTMLLSVIGNVLRFVMPYSAIWQCVVGFLALCSIMPFWGFIPLYLKDCMDYGEWKTGVRAQGIFSSLSGVSSKIGIGVGMGAIGLILGTFGYDASLAVQPKSTVYAIFGLSGVLPALFNLAVLLLLHFAYDLEKKLPGIRAELATSNVEATSGDEAK